jgi:hypothetical protein
VKVILVMMMTQSPDYRSPHRDRHGMIVAIAVAVIVGFVIIKDNTVIRFPVTLIYAFVTTRRGIMWGYNLRVFLDYRDMYLAWTIIIANIKTMTIIMTTVAIVWYYDRFKIVARSVQCRRSNPRTKSLIG